MADHTDLKWLELLSPAGPIPAWERADGRLTSEALRAAIAKVNEMTYTVCAGGDQHLVGPLDRGWTVCAALCGQVVWAGPEAAP